MDNQKIILNVENLNTTFVSDKKEIKIVKNVSFQVKRGKTLAVVGESGCGKSVTMNSIMRFTGKNAIVKADSIQYNALHDGKVTEYHLESITKPNGPEMRALRGPDLSMVFQDPMSSLNPVYKVGDQVAEGLLQHNKGMKKAEGYVIRKLEEEYVLIPCGERAEEMNETISLSETAGFIYINAGKADSTEELAGLVAEEYDVPKSEVLEDVKAVVKTLQQKGILL